MNRRQILTVITSGLIPLVTVGASAQQSTSLDASRAIPFANHDDDIAQAPFGGEVSRAIGQYNRVSPYIANAGLLHKGGLEEAQRLGFKLVVDLRGTKERGVSNEMKLAERLGIRRINIPVVERAPEWNQVDELAALIHDPANYPMLIHCVSSNRSGAIWSLYRARVGVSPHTAIEEGRTAGLTSREPAVRQMLDL